MRRQGLCDSSSESYDHTDSKNIVSAIVSLIEFKVLNFFLASEESKMELRPSWKKEILTNITVHMNMIQVIG